MWRCADCNKVFFSSNHGPHILDARTLCDDCLRVRYNTGKPLIPNAPTLPTHVGGVLTRPAATSSRVATFVTISGGASPNWAAIAMSGAMFMRGPGGIVNVQVQGNGPPSNEMTMEQMLAKVDQLLHLSPEERAAAKKVIRQMWGYVE